jgi:hypothetical protein
VLVHNGGELVQPVGDDDPLQSPESGALGGGEICGQQKNQTREEEDIEESLRGVPVSLFSDLHLEGQPSLGAASWSNGTLTYTPAPGYRGRDTITMSGTVMGAANGQSVNLGRQNTVYGVLVQ